MLSVIFLTPFGVTRYGTMNSRNYYSQSDTRQRVSLYSVI